MKRFALIGAAGFIAPRHMQAIKETKNDLVAIVDKNDSVGIIDSYFPNAHYFTEFERFDRHIEKLKRKGPQFKVDYVSICTPNYLHDAHIRFALRVGADAICEKPVVLNPWNVDALQEIEAENQKKVHTILQLRLHPEVIKLKQKIDTMNSTQKADIDLTYITSRGNWYLISWKGDVAKSGGIATNIGIHFFDLLNWIFGPVEKNDVHLNEETKAAGFLELKKARVRWFLSIDDQDLPDDVQKKNKRMYRSLKIGDDEIDLSTGFSNLHTISYKEILQGRGFSLEDARASIELAHSIRHANAIGKKGDYHPFLDHAA